MGRIRTTQIKRVAKRLMELHSNDFTDKFEGNQQIVANLISTPSKRLRNKVTGYVTKLVKINRNLKEYI